MSQESFEFVNVVGSFSSAACGVLREDWVDEEATRAEHEDEGILGTNVVVVFGISLNGEMHDRVFVLVFQQAKDDEGE